MVFGNLGKMAELLKQAKNISDELKKTRFESEGDGIKVTVSGEMEILELQLPTEAKANQVKDVINKALHSAKMESAKVMSKMTGGLGLPGL